ncbi:MAG: heavy-metal-associated domain-containing protein [Culicoidibacterales bacterium]
MKAKTLILVVEGIDNHTQVELLTAALHSVVGVTKASVSDSLQTVTVTYDDDTLHSGQQILDAITKVGVVVL